MILVGGLLPWIQIDFWEGGNLTTFVVNNNPVYMFTIQLEGTFDLNPIIGAYDLGRMRNIKIRGPFQSLRPSPL